MPIPRLLKMPIPRLDLTSKKNLSNQTHKIEIADQQSKPVDGETLISIVDTILTDHQIRRSEISIAIVDDPTMRKLNKQYLEHDYETDVLSFVLQYDDQAGELHGQLIVSTDTAATMANEVGGTMQQELLLYVVHGTLHLVGYDDKSPDDAREMRDAERKYLESVGLTHRWIEAREDSVTEASSRNEADQ